MTRTLVVIDGEHYPPVIEAALAGLSAAGDELVGALFAGGSEKTDRPPNLPIPVFAGDPATILPGLLDRLRPDRVLDLSDEPVIDHRLRMKLAGLALRAGVGYEGGGFAFSPPQRPRLTQTPTVAVNGTGKRTGKTALAIELARRWRDEGMGVCIVTMGRGGPPDPVVLRANQFRAEPAGLLDLARRGLHAASDYVEDAFLAGVDTVGTRRVGAGFAGGPVDDNFAAGVAAAERLEPDVILYEGSGTAIPPAAADRTVLVVSARLDPEYLIGYFGPYRLALADLMVIVAGPDDSGAAARLQALATEAAPDLAVTLGAYVPETTLSLAGLRLAVMTTAPPSAGGHLAEQLQALGADRVTTVHSLGDRLRLPSDLAGLGEVDALLTEIKAAAVDLVLPWAESHGLEVGFLHNRLVLEDDVDAIAAALVDRQPVGQAITS